MKFKIYIFLFCFFTTAIEHSHADDWVPSSNEISKQAQTMKLGVKFLKYHQKLFSELDNVAKWHPDCKKALEEARGDSSLDIISKPNKEFEKEIKLLENGAGELESFLARFSKDKYNPQKLPMSNCTYDNTAYWKRNLNEKCDQIIKKYAWSQELIDTPSGYTDEYIIDISEKGDQISYGRTSVVDTEEFKKEFENKEQVEKKYKLANEFCLNNQKVQRDIDEYYSSRLEIENPSKLESERKFLELYESTMTKLSRAKESDAEIKQLYDKSLICSSAISKKQDDIFKKFYYSQNLNGSGLRIDIWNAFNGSDNNIKNKIQKIEKICLSSPSYIKYVESILRRVSDETNVKSPFCTKQMNDYPKIREELLDNPGANCDVIGKAYCSENNLSYKKDKDSLAALNVKYESLNPDSYFPEINIRNTKIKQSKLDSNFNYWEEKDALIAQYQSRSKLNGVISIANNPNFAKVAYACFPNMFKRNDWLHSSMDYTTLCDDFYAFNYAERLIGQPDLPTSGACSFLSHNRSVSVTKTFPGGENSSQKRSDSSAGREE